MDHRLISTWLNGLFFLTLVGSVFLDVNTGLLKRLGHGLHAGLARRQFWSKRHSGLLLDLVDSVFVNLLLDSIERIDIDSFL